VVRGKEKKKRDNKRQEEPKELELQRRRIGRKGEKNKSKPFSFACINGDQVTRYPPP